MEGESELIGNLSLVGMRGNFVAVLNQRQLTIENRIGQGLRIDLNSISKMRHINIPILPSGTPVIGAIAVAIGYSILVPPIGWVVSLAGAFASLSYFRLRSSVLVIEDNDKSRHMIGGREGSLMRLCLMADRLRRGLSVEEARVGLEEIENELPLFPAFQDAGGIPAPKALPWPPSPPEIQTVGSGIGAEVIFDSGEVVPAISESMNFDFNMFGDVKEESGPNNDTAVIQLCHKLDLLRHPGIAQFRLMRGHGAGKRRLGTGRRRVQLKFKMDLIRLMMSPPICLVLGVCLMMMLFMSQRQTHLLALIAPSKQSQLMRTG